MLRKLYICFLCILIIFSLVVPAFATSSGAQSSAIAVSSFPIESVRFKNGSHYSVIDWPNNSASVDASQSTMGYYSGICAFECYYANHIFETVIFPDAAFSSATVSITDLFLTSNSSFVLSAGDSGGLRISSISFTGNFVTVSRYKEFGSDYESYTLLPVSFTRSFSVNDSSVDLASFLMQIPASLDISPGCDFVEDVYYFNCLDITINYYFDGLDPDDYRAMHFFIGEGFSEHTFKAWFSAFDFAIPNPDKYYPPSSGTAPLPIDGLYDWLLDAVNSFLELQVMPGLSINRIIYIVVIIGLFFAFLKIFS